MKKAFVFGIVILFIGVVFTPIFNAKIQTSEINFLEGKVGNGNAIKKEIPCGQWI